VSKTLSGLAWGMVLVAWAGCTPSSPNPIDGGRDAVGDVPVSPGTDAPADVPVDPGADAPVDAPVDAPAATCDGAACADAGSAVDGGPTPCTSDAACAPLGQVCDRTGARASAVGRGPTARA
jgi:hypothetical protein